MSMCPRCYGEIDWYPAISRRDNKTKICYKCGISEALFDYMKRKGNFTEKDAEEERQWLDIIKR